jgi:apolipoprotein D and lipocalin family protein
MKTLVFLTLITFSLCGWRLGRCPKIDREKGTFDPSRYMGKWFEQARDKAFVFSKGECVQADYSINQKGNVNVHNSEARDGKRIAVDGEAVVVDNFRLAVTFASNPFSKLVKGDYQILKTDYENYSIVYSCSNIVIGRFELVWVLTRKNEIDAENLNELIGFVNKIGFSNDNLHFTNQKADFCGY